MTDPLIAQLSLAEREGSNYRCIAIQLAVRLACAAPETAKRIAAEYDREVQRASGVEPPCAEAFAHIAGILREDADWSAELMRDEAPALKRAG